MVNQGYRRQINYLLQSKSIDMNVDQFIGNTPLVELKNISPNSKVRIFTKLEGQNPGGSVKDRAAYGMISKALKRGDIKTGDTLIEATSGNTGIALAMIASIKGLKMKLVMPDSATRERILTMKAYGAEVILTPAAKTIEYSREFAEKESKEKGYFILNQFANHDNYGIHFDTTGPEIWKQTDGKITHFVSAMGTTGTIMGVSKYLKSVNPQVRIVGTQPQEGSKIPGIRRWSPEFLPKIFDPKRIDQIIDVSQDEAIVQARQLAKQEGILAGMSSGGALAAALKLANSLEEGIIVTIACDKGDRYLSSDLFG
jgi:cysteine synthase B